MEFFRNIGRAFARVFSRGERREAPEGVVVSAGIGNDDFRPAGAITDGGKTFASSVQVQTDNVIVDGSWNVVTPHNIQREEGGPRERITRERPAMGVPQLRVGMVHTAEQPLSEGTTLQSQRYVAASISTNDVRVTPRLQEAVHEWIGGTHVAGMYTGEGVPNGPQVGAQITEEWRVRGFEPGGVEVVPSAFVAAEIGTDRRSAAVGGRVTVGQHIDTLPQPIPQANPEAAAPDYVQNMRGQRGAWLLSAGVAAYTIPENQFLPTGNRDQNIVGADVRAAYAITDRVIVSGSLEHYENPAHGIRDVPETNTVVGGKLHIRF